MTSKTHSKCIGCYFYMILENFSEYLASFYRNIIFGLT